MDSTDLSATQAAFRAFRAQWAARPPKEELIRNEDEVRLMTPADGILAFQDGPVADVGAKPSLPEITSADKANAYLWVVRRDVVCYALEACEWGKRLQTRVIKHTNLTGGVPAHCGGELLWFADDTVIVNGQSGRYGPRSAAEMKEVALAFRRSGYRVWSMGYDEEANWPYPFLGVAPEWIA